MKILILFSIFNVIAHVRSSSYCVGEEDIQAKLDDQVEAPSPAPSINFACQQQTSNARGRYTSTKAPCTFHFHKVESTNEVDLIKFRTSDLCSSENSFLSVREYVSEWPDECVGDFERCYSLEHHRSVVWDFVCSKDWSVPEGTTHVSMDCQEDKELVATTQRREEQIKVDHETRRETYESKFYNLAMIFGACLVSVFALANLIVKPFVMLRSTTRWSCNHHVLPRSNSCGCDVCHGMCLEVQDLQIEEGDEHDFDSQVPDFDAVPIAPASNFDTQVPADFDAFPIAPATVSSWGTNDSYFRRVSTLTHSSSELTEDARTNDASINTDFDGIPMAPATYSSTDDETLIHSRGEMILEGEEQYDESVNDFDSQIPADFDAIPIVAATMLYS